MRSILSHIVGSDRESAFEFAEVIRAEIFSAERLEQHAASLAAAQTVTTRPVAVRPLTARLSHNHRALLDAHRAIRSEERRVVNECISRWSPYT